MSEFPNGPMRESAEAAERFRRSLEETIQAATCGCCGTTMRTEEARIIELCNGLTDVLCPACYDNFGGDDVESDAKRFDWFFEPHIGIGVRWYAGDLEAYPFVLSIALPFVTVVIGFGRERV